MESRSILLKRTNCDSGQLIATRERADHEGVPNMLGIIGDRLIDKGVDHGEIAAAART